jgi:curved DNA-binding protein CbpA
MSQSSENIVGLGARTDYLAQVPNADVPRLRLTAEEGRLFAQVGRASRIDELLARSGLEEPRAIALLLSLRAKGAVVPARVSRPASPASVDAAMAEEVELPPERKKEILDLERALERLDAFELLGLRPGATAEEAKKAWYDASRRYHPDRYFGKNVGSFRARIDRIYKRLTEAYNTLSDPPKRAAYLAAHPELAFTAAPKVETPESSERTPLDPQRAAERRERFARHPYLAKRGRVNELLARARGHIEAGAPGLAYTDLHLASQMEPANKDVQQLLSEARRKHEIARREESIQKGTALEGKGDLRGALEQYRIALSIDPQHAGASLRAAAALSQLGQDPNEARVLAQRAVDLEPRNADALVVLARVLLDAGMKKLAKKHCDDALAFKPNHPEAKKLIKKLRWPFAGL